MVDSTEEIVMDKTVKKSLFTRFGGLMLAVATIGIVGFLSFLTVRAAQNREDATVSNIASTEGDSSVVEEIEGRIKEITETNEQTDDSDSSENTSDEDNESNDTDQDQDEDSLFATDDSEGQVAGDNTDASSNSASDMDTNTDSSEDSTSDNRDEDSTSATANQKAGLPAAGATENVTIAVVLATLAYGITLRKQTES